MGDEEVEIPKGNLVVHLAVEASFRRPRWFNLSTERERSPLFLASRSASLEVGGFARVIPPGVNFCQISHGSRGGIIYATFLKPDLCREHVSTTLMGIRGKIFIVTAY